MLTFEPLLSFPFFPQPRYLFWSPCVWSNIGPWLLSLNIRGSCLDSLTLIVPCRYGSARASSTDKLFYRVSQTHQSVCFWCTDPHGSAAWMTQNWFLVSVINIIASRPLHASILQVITLQEKKYIARLGAAALQWCLRWHFHYYAFSLYIYGNMWLHWFVVDRHVRKEKNNEGCDWGCSGRTQIQTGRGSCIEMQLTCLL